MAHNPGWRVYQCWQGNNSCFSAIYFQEDVHEDTLCALLLPTNTTSAELFKSLNDYTSGKLNWSFCVGMMYRQWLPRLDSLLVSLLGSKRLLLNVSLHNAWSIDTCRLVKIFLSIFWTKNVLQGALQNFATFCSSMRKWTQHTHLLLYTVMRWLSKGRSL